MEEVTGLWQDHLSSCMDSLGLGVGLEGEIPALGMGSVRTTAWNIIGKIVYLNAGGKISDFGSIPNPRTPNVRLSPATRVGAPPPCLIIITLVKIPTLPVFSQAPVLLVRFTPISIVESVFRQIPTWQTPKALPLVS